jgi:hypothetical protein
MKKIWLKFKFQYLFAENKEKLINSALTAMISKDFGDDVNMLEQQFHALRRLVASKAGFSGFTSLPGFREKVQLINNGLHFPPLRFRFEN